MRLLIDARGQVIAERWSLLAPASVLALATTAKDWKGGMPCNVGMLLEASDDPAVIEGVGLARIGLVGVRLPSATDGRGYSIARLLRGRYRWQGPLRALGEVARDQLAYLQRCGFDQFMLREGETLEGARAGLRGFSEHYQASSDGGPLFERRAA